MHTFLDTIRRLINTALLRLEQDQTRRYLMSKDDRFLRDIGVSRFSLEWGFPARPSKSPAQIDEAKIAAKSRRRAISELMAYSNRELMEIGIARFGIADAVDYGRSGIER